MEYTKEINKKENSEIEIKGELKAEDFASFWPLAIKKLGAEAKIDGFRPGHVPEKILVEKIGEEKVLWEMAENAIGAIYPEIITTEKIAAIGQPAVTITKIAKDNPLGFVITTAVMPEFKLPDYTKISAQAKKDNPTEEVTVSDEEVAEFMENVKKAHQTKDEQGQPTGELPEINDEFIKKFGQFKNVEDFTKTITEQLKVEKASKAREKTRVKILDAIAEKTEINIPEILIESELGKMWQEMSGQIEQMGMKMDDYLKHLKKTKEDLFSTWRDDAIKRVKLGLIIQKIAEDQKIEIPTEKLETETNNLLTRIPNPEKAHLETVKNYVQNMLINEEVLTLLEKSGQ